MDTRTKAYKKARTKSAEELHKGVPPNWYFLSLKIDPFQKYWHKRRFEEVSRFTEPTNGSILDVGCADGMFSKVVYDRTKPSKYIGLDVLKKSVDWANKHWENIKAMEFLVADAQELPFKNESFDAVYCLEALEHVHNPKKVLSEFIRVLKKKGYGVFLVPSDSFLFRALWFFWLHFYPRGWVWRDTHLQSYKKEYLSKLAKEAGFRVEKEKMFNLGMLYLIKVRKP